VPKLGQPDTQPTGDMLAIGRYRGITLVCSNGALKGAYPLVVDISHNTLNRLQVRPSDADHN